MEPDRPTVVVVDDDAAMRELIAKALGKHYRVLTADAPRRALELVREERPSAVLTDLRMGGVTARGERAEEAGIALCRDTLAVDPELPVVVMTAFGSLDSAVAAMRAGAFDFVTKPIEMEALGFALARAIKTRRLGQEVARLRASVDPDGGSPLLGTSAALSQVRDLVHRLAASDVSVLLTGESGTGKEVTARAIHGKSARARGPFVGVNCAAIPEALLESELFGHKRGAFTDAKSDHVGLFVQAQGGTLLLDEIGDMPLALQPKLLRALEERVVRPLGGGAEVPIDVRVVAATHRDLEEAIRAGRFREDLFYRLNVVELALPPLRARGDDVLILAQHFLTVFAERARKPAKTFGPDVAALLLGYGWPGNVRELANAMERAVALSAADRIAPDDLPNRLRAAPAEPAAAAAMELVSLEEMERRYILRAFELLGRSRSLTAQTLQIDRKTLYRKLDKWGLSGS